MEAEIDSSRVGMPDPAVEHLPTGALTHGARLGWLAREFPDTLGLTFVTEGGSEEHFSFADLERRSNQLARLLAAHGAEQDTVLAMPIRNSPLLVSLCHAIWKLGGCALALNPKAPERELDGMLEAARTSGRPVMLVADLPGADLTPSQLDRFEKMDDGPLPDRVSQPGKAIGSGGSTGRPKIVIDPRPWAAVPPVPGSIDAFGRRPEHVVLIPGPLYHNGPFVPFFVALFDGTHVILMERFDAAKAVEVIERHRVGWTFMVPTQMARIARLPHLDAQRLASLEGLYHSGSGCAAWLKKAWFDLIGPEAVFEVFGSSEQIGAFFIRGDEWLRHPNTVGKPDLIDVKVIGASGKEVPVGVVGEIFMRWKPDVEAGFLAPSGDSSLMYAYWGSEPLRSLDGGFATAGDLGYLDEDGYLHLADRRHDLIISGGANVYPSEVEEVLSAVKGVEDVVVIGVDDPDWGQRVHAVVQLAPGSDLNADALDRVCREQLAPHKRPKAFEFVASLPRTESGKIRRSLMAAERSSS